MAGCSSDVLVSFAESLHIYTGLLTVATVCGGLTGIVAAALLYAFCLKPLLLTRQVSNYSIAHSSDYLQRIISVLMCTNLCFALRDTTQGGCLNLMMGGWTRTRVTVSATAERRLPWAPIMIKYTHTTGSIQYVLIRCLELSTNWCL